jgi:hypothetical protein
LTLIVFYEANVKGSLAKALSAHIEVVLANDGALAATYSAATGTLGAELALGMSIEKLLAAHRLLVSLKASVRLE